jgi:hypothetical protein
MGTVRNPVGRSSTAASCDVRSSSRPTGRTPGAGVGRTVSSGEIWISSQQDGLDHLVTLEQAGATVHTGTGVYTAICAARFVPLPMIARPGPPCRRCQALRRPDAKTARAPRRTGVHRLLRRIGRRAA